MSSKKKYNTIGMAREVWDQVEAAAMEQRRSRSFIIEECCRQLLGVPAQAGEKEKDNGHKS